MNAPSPNVGRFPRRWLLIVVGLLFTHTSLMILAVTVFVHNHGDIVIPDYYDKAVHWDQIKAAHAQEQRELDAKAQAQFKGDTP